MIRRLLSKRFVRILLCFFITLVTLVVLLYVWTNWSGRRRWAATKAMLERTDTIIVATVSAIYGLGEPDEYHSMVLHLRRGDMMTMRTNVNATTQNGRLSTQMMKSMLLLLWETKSPPPQYSGTAPAISPRSADSC